ncbi:SMP-30/gluconolactonase/LRE family protein [Rhodococcus koreensis]
MNADPPRVEDVSIVADIVDELGEGPVWLANQATLLRVDIQQPAIVVLDPVSGRERRRRVDAPVGFALPASGGGLVAGIGRRLALLPELDGPVRYLAEVEPDHPANRFNDAICDPYGRLWAGTIARGKPGTAALYKVIAGHEPEVAIPNVTISNGLDWDCDAKRLYYIDSPTHRIDAIDFDLDRGRFGARRPFVAIAPADGEPDGLCVDADGGVWVALFGGGAVRRYWPDGSLDLHLPVPVTNPTSLAFGGADLTDLYITSARVGLTPEQLTREPHAGALLRVRPGVRGRPPHAFGS